MRLRRFRINSPEELRLYRRTIETVQGFTLLELLIVITVLGVLAAIVIFALGGITAKSAVAACDADANTVETAVQAYNAQTGGTVPATPQTLTNSTNPYLQSFPSSPYFAISLDGSGNVMIAAPIGAAPVSYGTPNACAGAASTSSTSSTSTTTTSTPPSTTSTTTTSTTVPATTTTSTSTTSTTTSTTTTTTTTTTPTTTTTIHSAHNGVTVKATSDNSNRYSGTETLTIKNSHAITQMIVTISVVETDGVTPASSWNNFPGDLTQSVVASNGTISYTWTLSSTDYAVPAHSDDQVTAQWAGTGITHPVSGDTWSVTSTSNSNTWTLSGSF